MAKYLQPTMSGGELSPGLQGRVDLARYATSLKTCRNVIIKPTGGAIKRPGTIYCGTVKATETEDSHVRLVPFVYSTDVKYLIEMGDGYLRFWVGGALLRDGSDVPVEVVSPYTGDDIYDVRFTQSADVLFLVHPTVRPKMLRRLTATSFELVDFNYRRGPFRAINTDEAAIMAVSGTQGIVTVTTNVDTFTAEMVNALLYVEEKELRSVKPWTAGERSVALGTYRRSDSKVYRCVSVPSVGGGDYYVCGGTRPTHEAGRAFDGPQDAKDDGVNNYVVGVEWEYIHGGFGILQITEYVSALSVKALVIERIPDSLIGTAPTPSGTWTFSGDGTTKVFSITGATSNSYLDYAVTIDGAPAQSNPNYPGGGSGDGTCPSVDARVVERVRGIIRAGDVMVGDYLLLCDPDSGIEAWGEVTYSQRKAVEGVRLACDLGALTCSTTAPIPTEAGFVLAPDLMGHSVLCKTRGIDQLATVSAVESVGEIDVQHITVGDRCFWTGDTMDALFLHHNAKRTE